MALRLPKPFFVRNPPATMDKNDLKPPNFSVNVSTPDTIPLMKFIILVVDV